jgi:hypothetical protein
VDDGHGARQAVASQHKAAGVLRELARKAHQLPCELYQQLQGAAVALQA